MTAFFPFALRGVRPNSSKIAAAMGAVWLAAACSQNSTDLRYDIAHPISVERAPQLLELPISTSISEENERRIDKFARRFLVAGENALTVAYPMQREKEAVPFVKAIVKKLQEVGVPKNRVRRGLYDAVVDGARGVVLSFDGSTALSAGCPDVLGDSTRDPSNKTPKYYGCATQNNLAAMIDRPTDLVEPRTLTPADAARRQTVIESYRVGDATAADSAGEDVDTRSQ